MFYVSNIGIKYLFNTLLAIKLVMEEDGLNQQDALTNTYLLLCVMLAIM